MIKHFKANFLKIILIIEIQAVVKLRFLEFAVCRNVNAYTVMRINLFQKMFSTKE